MEIYGEKYFLLHSFTQSINHSFHSYVQFISSLQNSSIIIIIIITCINSKRNHAAPLTSNKFISITFLVILLKIIIIITINVHNTIVSSVSFRLCKITFKIIVRIGLNVCRLLTRFNLSLFQTQKQNTMLFYSFVSSIENTKKNKGKNQFYFHLCCTHYSSLDLVINLIESFFHFIFQLLTFGTYFFLFRVQFQSSSKCEVRRSIRRLKRQ